MPRRRRNAAPTSRQNDDRLCNPPPGQRQQQEQPPQQNLQNASAAEADDSTAVALSIPAAVAEADDSPPSAVLVMTNLDNFLRSVSPLVPLKNLSEVNSKGSGRVEMDSYSFFRLEDLWESFHEWSVYGVGVPLLLNGKDPIEQFYIPNLSGIQLYRDTPQCSSQLSADCSRNSRGGNGSVLGSTGDFADLYRTPLFQYFEYESPYQRLPLTDKVKQYFEYESPYQRLPLTDKIWELSSQYPELITCRSCDLLPTSWICVAWYPIYRIPVVPKLRHLEASFLTFYSLSIQSKNTTNMHGNGDPNDKYPLPVFGLVSQKFKGSMMSSYGTQECEQESSLLQAAEDWMGQLNIMLPDYRYFRFHDRTR